MVINIHQEIASMMKSVGIDTIILLRAALGQWASYPPHKHDDDNMPTEAATEETAEAASEEEPKKTDEA